MHIKFFTTLSALCLSLASIHAQPTDHKSTCPENAACCATNKSSSSSKTASLMPSDLIKKNQLVACTLTSPELQKRKSEVIGALKQQVLTRVPVENGYRYTFKGSDGMLDQLLDFIKAERACCTFFTFQLSVEDAQSDLVLLITGPEGTKEFLDNEIGF